MSDPDSSGSGLQRRDVLMLLAAGGTATVASSGQAAAQTSIGGGDMTDPIADARAKLYELAESELPDNPIEGQIVKITSGGSQFSAGDVVEPNGSGGWQTVDLGVGALEAKEQSFGDGDIIVSPSSHDFDDIVDLLNNGNDVFAKAGSYDAWAGSEQRTVSDGSLTMANDAQVDVPNDPRPGWLYIEGSTGSPTSITSDVSAGDSTLSVSSTSNFESGKPALINDDGGYETMSGRGECVYIAEVVDSTTLELREPVGLSHSTTDTISIEQIDPLTSDNSWDNVTFDCRGSDQSGGDHPLIFRRYVDGHVLRDIEFINGEGSSMHQYLEDRHSWRPKTIGAESGRVEDGDLGLLTSLEQRTKRALLADSTVYHGTVCEFGNNGDGPSQQPELRNVTAIGAHFSSNDPVIEPQYINCTASNPDYNYEPNEVGFGSDGTGATFINCTVKNGKHGWNLRGKNETLIDCRADSCIDSAILWGGTNDGVSDQHTGIKTVTGFTAINNDVVFNSVSSPNKLSVRDVTAIGNGKLISASDQPTLVEVDGGVLKADGGSANSVAPFDVPRLVLRDLDVDCGGALTNDWLRETSADSPTHIRVENCDFYDTSNNSAVRLENFGTLVMVNCRAPQNEVSVGNYLLRDDGGGNNVVIRGNDARGADVGNGYLLDSNAEISDGTNIANDGTTL